MNAPVNLYFDVTPSSKLLKNFTEDIGRTDRAFFWHINWVFECIADLIFKIGIAIFFSPYMIIPVAVNMYMLYLLAEYTKNGKSETDRMRN